MPEVTSDSQEVARMIHEGERYLRVTVKFSIDEFSVTVAPGSTVEVASLIIL